MRAARTDDLTDVSVARGAMVPADAPICVVVMSVNSEPTTGEAVHSILDQGVSAEVVVVNTGRGTVRDQIAPYAERVTLVETPTKQYAGGARNLGIRHSSAPIVAFLAADCLATEGWLTKRIKGHETHRSVASAIRPAPMNGRVSPTSWGAYVIIHYLRMPEVPVDIASFCGQSYERTIFDEHGLFDEQMRIAEDSVFNLKIERAIGKPLWNPDLVTLHRYPSALFDGLADQYRRGQRISRYVTDISPLRHALGALKWNLIKGMRVRKSVPLNPMVFSCLSIAQVAGILTGRMRSSP